VPLEAVIPAPPPEPAVQDVAVRGWPFDPAEARRRQAALGAVRRTLDLGGGVTMEFVRIPAGSFVMGDAEGEGSERPRKAVTIARPFWLGVHEVTNEQYARFDPRHDSRFEHRTSWIFSEEYLGWPLNRPEQPAVRVSFDDTTAFCRWLSARIGQEVTLPTEEQWEYACRAGTETSHFYGDRDTDFAPFANMADVSLKDLAYDGWRPKSPDLVPRDGRFNDHALVTAAVGSYQPNPWDLHDMHGNAAEWTRTTCGGLTVVRGGSWRDRPKRCRSAARLSYRPYQRVFNVGFRVALEDRRGAAGAGEESDP
jgi:formylglycine-generating enzyme required for sulfatase activity